MTKAIAIIILGLLLGGNAYSKGFDVKFREKNEYGAIILIKAPMLDGSYIQYSNALEKTRDMAVDHCKSFNKETYAFWSEKSDYFARDKSGKLYIDDGDAFHFSYGIVQDWHWKMLTYNFRYYCANSPNEAYVLLKKDDQLFKKKYKSGLNFANLFYSEINTNPFNFKSLSSAATSLPKTDPQKEKELEKFAKIEEYKKTCSAIGFELGTDKFTDCTLKLFVADNKETTQIVQSSSGAQEIIIRDPDRERRIGTKAFSDFVNGKCQINLLSKNPCQF